MQKTVTSQAFTLIELSIVLVIIGLIVGGVLVGQDLMGAASVRATITQIETFNQATNTFLGKYGALPGDMNAATANTFGFTARGTGSGEGDGNGLIQVIYCCGSNGTEEVFGETAMFWVDLTYANGLKLNMIPGSFSAATPNNFSTRTVSTSKYLPAAKIGRGNYIYVWSGGYKMYTSNNSLNYFGIEIIPSITSGSSLTGAKPGLTVAEANSIDNKIDDGFPQMGHVTAVGIGNLPTGPAEAEVFLAIQALQRRLVPVLPVMTTEAFPALFKIIRSKSMAVRMSTVR